MGRYSRKDIESIRFSEIKQRYTEKLSEWRINFQLLKTQLLKYEYTFKTKAKLQEIQCIVDEFIINNQINVKIIVNYVEDSLILMGCTLEDELIWTSIQ